MLALPQMARAKLGVFHFCYLAVVPTSVWRHRFKRRCTWAWTLHQRCLQCGSISIATQGFRARIGMLTWCG